MSIAYCHHGPDKYGELTFTPHLTLKMTTAKVVEVSVNINTNSSSLDCTYLDDLNLQKCNDNHMFKAYFNPRIPNPVLRNLKRKGISCSILYITIVTVETHSFYKTTETRCMLCGIWIFGDCFLLLWPC